LLWVLCNINPAKTVYDLCGCRRKKRLKYKYEWERKLVLSSFYAPVNVLKAIRVEFVILKIMK
jgi:hypothetical protein